MRTPEEFAQGHAPAAINIPVQELQDRLAEVPPSPLLILCRSGVRAGNAYGIILSSGRPAEGIWYLKGYTDFSGGGMRFHE